MTSEIDGILEQRLDRAEAEHLVNDVADDLLLRIADQPRIKLGREHARGSLHLDASLFLVEPTQHGFVYVADQRLCSCSSIWLVLGARSRRRPPLTPNAGGRYACFMLCSTCRISPPRGRGLGLAPRATASCPRSRRPRSIRLRGTSTSLR